jgi:hypothetical protein
MFKGNNPTIMRDTTLNYRAVEDIKEKLNVSESQISDAADTVGCYDPEVVEHYLADRLQHNNCPR